MLSSFTDLGLYRRLFYHFENVKYVVYIYSFPVSFWLKVNPTNLAFVVISRLAPFMCK